MIKAVIFDMDGLLINSEEFWQESESKVFNALGVSTNKDMFVQFMGKRIDEVVDLMWIKQQWKSSSKIEVVNSIVENVIQRVTEKGIALPGVIDTLDAVRKNNYKIALASSSKMKIINAVLDKLMIRDYFEVIHSAEFENFGKPHPQIFITTAKMLSVKPSECLVFEDSLNGVIAALAANMKCIAVPERNATNRSKFIIADKVLDSLIDFKVTDLKLY